MEQANKLLEVLNTSEGVRVNTAPGIRESSCAELLAAIALNFEHGGSGMDAVALLTQAVQCVDDLRATQIVMVAS